MRKRRLALQFLYVCRAWDFLAWMLVYGLLTALLFQIGLVARRWNRNDLLILGFSTESACRVGMTPGKFILIN